MKIKDFKNIIEEFEELKNSVNDISESIQNFDELEQENKKKELDIPEVNGDENLMMKKKIFKTVKETNEAIKEAHEAMNIEDFENKKRI